MDIRAIYYLCNTKWYGNDFMAFLLRLYAMDPFCRKLKISNKGSIKLKSKEVEGKHNQLIVGHQSLLNRVIVVIHGSNNRITIGDKCKIGRNCKLFLYGDNVELKIGYGCTFIHDDELLVQEDNARIVIGDDCMFSHHINVRTSDAHPIFSMNGERINKAKNVHIGNHVWITPHCIIQKGVTINDGAIIATRSIVTKDIPAHTIAAGMPAKVFKEGVDWGRRIEKGE